ncbi:MAG: hypothetical protein ACK5X7_05110 [Pseudanabaena sp.]
MASIRSTKGNLTALHEQVREQAEKKPKWTTLIIVDSQATKNTCNATEL